MLEPVGVLAIAAVLGPARGLHVGRAPGLGPERAQGGRRVKGRRPHLHVVRLEDDAALIGPVALELEDQVLEGQSLRLSGLSGLIMSFRRASLKRFGNRDAIRLRRKESHRFWRDNNGRRVNGSCRPPFAASLWPIDAGRGVALQRDGALGLAALQGLLGGAKLGGNAPLLVAYTSAFRQG